MVYNNNKNLQKEKIKTNKLTDVENKSGDKGERDNFEDWDWRAYTILYEIDN